MSYYRGYENSRGRGTSAVPRYYQHSFQQQQNPAAVAGRYGRGQRPSRGYHPGTFTGTYGYKNGSASASASRTDYSLENSAASFQMNMQNPPPLLQNRPTDLFSQPAFVQPPPLMLGFENPEPFRPGPYAKKPSSSKTSPVASSQDSEAKRKKAFDAKRLKPLIGDNSKDLAVTGDEEEVDMSQEGGTSFDQPRVTRTVSDPNLRQTSSNVDDNAENAARKREMHETLRHITATDAEIAGIDAEVEAETGRFQAKIRQLRTKRNQLTRQRAAMAQNYFLIDSDLLSVSGSAVTDAQRPHSAQQGDMPPDLMEGVNAMTAPDTIPPLLQQSGAVSDIPPLFQPNSYTPKDRESLKRPASNTSPSAGPGSSASKSKRSSNGVGGAEDNSAHSSFEAATQPQGLRSFDAGADSLPAPAAKNSALIQQLFRDVDSGCSPRGSDDNAYTVTSFVTVDGDPDVLLIGCKSGHVWKYSLSSQSLTRKEFIFRKSVSALCGLIFEDELKIFAGSSDGDYRCYNGTLSEVVSQNRFGWGICIIKYLLNHVYLGIGNGLISVICPKRLFFFPRHHCHTLIICCHSGGVVLERFSCGSSYIYDIEALQESARDTIVCSLKTNDQLLVRDAADGLHLRSIDLPRLLSSGTNATVGGATCLSPSLKQVHGVASPLACTHLVCAGGFIFGCQANGQFIAVLPGDTKARILDNLDSRPMALSVVGFHESNNGIYLAVVTANVIVRVFLVSSTCPMGAAERPSKKRRGSVNLTTTTSDDSEEDSNTEASLKTQINCDKLFHASMASPGYSLGHATITSSGLICLISLEASSSETEAVPWILEIFKFPKMLTGEKS